MDQPPCVVFQLPCCSVVIFEVLIGDGVRHSLRHRALPRLAGADVCEEQGCAIVCVYSCGRIDVLACPQDASESAEARLVAAVEAAAPDAKLRQRPERTASRRPYLRVYYSATNGTA